ncbi:MAG: acetoacetate decarboxylase family protein [Chloroflexi bacterium]|nr:acetoacetate decarboxylase family protein [Chloroflexota bacterium]
MPLVGTRDVTPLGPLSPLLPSFETPHWELRGATVLQVMYELEEEGMLSLLPPALHPTIPPTVLFNVTSVPDSPAGPFTLAEVRVGCRSAARPRAFLVRGYTDSAGASTELRTHWGYPVGEAAVVLRKGYDRVHAIVEVDGRTILDVALMNPEPISGGDVQYLANMNLARVDRNGSELLRLVQVDPDFVFHRADRGTPRLLAFEADAWGIDGAVPYFPISASVTTCDITMPQIRYLVDPAKPPLQAIETVGRS